VTEDLQPLQVARRCISCLAIALLIPLEALAQTECKDPGVTFGFFNGVQTTEEGATQTVSNLRHVYGPTTPAGHPITYELFYNDSQGFSDFVETFDQRLREQNGQLAGAF